MDDTAPAVGAAPTDPYPNFVEDVLDEPETTAPASGAPPAAPAATPAAPAPPGAPGSATQPPGAAPAAQPPAEGSVPSPSATPPAPPTPAVPASWDFNADRQTIIVPGSKVRDDGWVEIPPDQRPLIEQLLAEGAAHRGSWRTEQQQYEERIAQLERANTTNPEVVRAKAFNDAIQGLLAKGPDAVAAWLDDYRVNFPLLQKEAENAVLKRQLDERNAEFTSVAEAQEAAQLEPALRGMLDDTIQQVIASDASYAGVNAKQLFDRIRTRYLDQVAYEVTPDQRPRGLADGEILLGHSRDGKLLYVFNAGLVADEVAYQATLRGSATTAAAARNAAMTPPAPGTAPTAPVVPAAGQPTAPVPTVALPKTREELQKWIDSGAWKGSFPGS